MTEHQMTTKDSFYTQESCDRCGGALIKGRTMSMFNTECICLDCKNKERERPDYQRAVNADNSEIMKGNTTYRGIGLN